jgi:RNA polymerase sigma-70 factor (ECF subfamily)
MNPPVTIETTPESQLIREVQAGNLHSFAELVDRHLDHIRGFIALKLPVPHLVNEIAHETFVFAFRNLTNFAAETQFRSWLRAIATNLVRAELQRYQREQTNRLNYARYQVWETNLARKNESPARLDFLRECLDELPVALQQLAQLKYTRELPIAEIAQKQGRTQTAVWQALFRLRHQLKLCVEGKMNQGTHERTTVD